MKSWDQIYTLPLTNRDGWVYDATDIFVFEFPEHVKTGDIIVKVLNGKAVYDKGLNIHYKVENQYIYVDDIPLISIRGYGYLNGYLKLSEEESANIQDTFAEWIISKLNS